mgnify:CR=1 FL=1
MGLEHNVNADSERNKWQLLMERVSDLVHKQDVTIADVREKHASLQGQVEALGIALLGQGHAAQANYADGPAPALSGPRGAPPTAAHADRANGYVPRSGEAAASNEGHAPSKPPPRRQQSAPLSRTSPQSASRCRLAPSLPARVAPLTQEASPSG